MKYRGIFEYEYPTEHKPPVSIDVHLHGDCVKGKIIEWEYRPLKQEPKPMVEIDLYSVIKQKYIEREVLDKIRAEIIKYEGDCRLSIDEYPSCEQCTDNVFKTIYGIFDRYKAE